MIAASRSPGRRTARLRQRSLVSMRWIALIGQAVALGVAGYGLGLPIPFVPAMAVILVAGACNVAVALWRPGAAWLTNGEAAAMLAFDLLQLALVLGLTGGLENPFAMLILAPVTAAAWALSWRFTAGLSLLAGVLVLLLGAFALPIQWPAGSYPPSMLFKLGHGIALEVAIAFIAGYVALLAREARQLSQALNASQLALAREQRLSALGGLAAAAAHELGSPLGTLAVVARELDRALPADSPHRDDVDLLLAETARCRRILEGIGRNPEQDGGTPYNLLPLTGLIEAAIVPFRPDQGEPRLRLETPDPADWTPPLTPRDPQVIHGLSSLVENAVAFAREEVSLCLSHDGSAITLEIMDDGPGFDLGHLSELGEPYFSTGQRGRQRHNEGPHLGLGLFIARSLLAHSGAELTLANRRQGGARVTVHWPQGPQFESAPESGVP